MKRAAPNKKNNKNQSNQFRVIGGQWRGRKLQFVDGLGLRPTLDRVRETLFNWLQGEIVGARCLDLFAGSGALGIEALSRQASEVIFVDNNPQAAQMIKQNIQVLKTSQAQVINLDAHKYLVNQSSANDDTFDIVFLDPPFNQNLVNDYCHLLASSQCLSDHATIYIEIEKNTKLNDLPQDWRIAKEKQAGQLAYYLIHT